MGRGTREVLLAGALCLAAACAGSRRASAPAPFSRLAGAWLVWTSDGGPAYEISLALPWDELESSWKSGDSHLRLVATAQVSNGSGKVLRSKTWSKQIERREAATVGDLEWSLELATEPGGQTLSLNILVQGQPFGAPWQRHFEVPEVEPRLLFVQEPVFLACSPRAADGDSCFPHVLLGRTYDARTGPPRFRTVIYDFAPAANSSTFHFHTELVDLDRDQEDEGGSRLRFSQEVERRGTATPLIMELPELPLGRYRLRLQVEDAARQARNEGQFEVGLTALADVGAGEGGAELYRLLLGTEQADSLLAAPPEARDALWEGFWRRRDPDPSTAANEARDSVLTRVRYANRFFGGDRSGWRTDRGRVYILHGAPDRVEVLSNSEGSDRIERWTYDTARLVFVFIDRDGRGDYTLLRTNAREY